MKTLKDTEKEFDKEWPNAVKIIKDKHSDRYEENRIGEIIKEFYRQQIKKLLEDRKSDYLNIVKHSEKCLSSEFIKCEACGYWKALDRLIKDL